MPDDVSRAFANPDLHAENFDPCDGAIISEANRRTKGETDFYGDTIDRVFVSTEQFIIYAVEQKDDQVQETTSPGSERRWSLARARRPVDHIWLRAILVDDYKCARRLRGRLADIAPELARICDIVDGLCTSGGLGDQAAHYRRRKAEVMARAIQMAFEDRGDMAKAILAELSKQVTTLRDSKNRMRYVTANAVMLLVLLLAVAGLRLVDLFPSAFLPRAAELKVHVLDVLAAGAVGAFFSVSMTIRALVVNHSVNRMEMLWTGAVRVLIGVIAAAVTILLFAGGWVLGSVDQSAVPWVYLLLGFLAGFSEMFVPNALQQVEGGVGVAAPETTRTA